MIREFNSSTLASGIYLYKLKAGDFTENKEDGSSKMII